MKFLLYLQALFNQRARAELVMRRAAAAAARAAGALVAAKKVRDKAIDNNRRDNYQHPINFLADTLIEHNRFPPLTDAEWEAKKAGWRAAGNYDAMYASTDPDRYGRLGGIGGKFAGQPYAVIEAEVRRLCSDD